MSNIQRKQQADAQFKKLPRMGNGMSAHSEYEAAADALAAKIARLKELAWRETRPAQAAPLKAACFIWAIEGTLIRVRSLS